MFTEESNNSFPDHFNNIIFIRTFFFFITVKKRSFSEPENRKNPKPTLVKNLYENIYKKEKKCFYYENNLKENRYEVCVSSLGIKTIIVEKDKLAFNENFTCETNELIRISRNIFLTRREKVDFCKLK